MEYLWYVLAAAGAGIGTGLAGLSAATVMVPILIVLCPSFSGEAGAYQATAVALASDILGSAVTTTVYIRHKNIDLRRGWIMLVCILGMCIGGSFAAYRAGNVVLGGFSLFLTFCIGIRFLVKPETERKQPLTGKFGLDKKGIAISLFFGLTIGFGTGFVGTGGGMMMLIVFTAFLGMSYKTAVGTSTFIMTFTALIASVSHMMIEPSILLERWDVLLICVSVATFSSLVSARFANRVKSRTVSLVTGGVLVVLGGALILLRMLRF
ncbi:MAG: sulfite exporter TauE/SafE family protein [bacterium]|nr:sulfite exporter TauE/SafE family protein [bacterium]